LLAIRLARTGKRKKPSYRIVVIEKTRPRDGRFVEILGTYNPQSEPADVRLKEERVKYWLGVGAQPSQTVRSFFARRKLL
jgi:small subunit ribosomal protein S16